MAMALRPAAGKPEAFPHIPTDVARRFPWVREVPVTRLMLLTAWRIAGRNPL